VDGNPIPQFVIDKDHKIIHWNKALEAITGIKSDEVVGTRKQWSSFYDYPRPTLADLLLDKTYGLLTEWYGLQDLKASALDGAYEARGYYQRQGRDAAWVHFTAAIIRDAEGNVIGAVETLEDITEYVRRSNELSLKNLILATQQETSIDGILVVDEHGKMVSFNQKFLKMWGIPSHVAESGSDELAVQTIMGKLVDPASFAAKLRDLYANHDQTSLDEVVLTDGTVFDRYSAPMIGPEGRYYGRVWYFRDVTDRKRAEHALRKSESLLRRVLDILPIGLWIADGTGQLLLANPACMRIWGAQPLVDPAGYGVFKARRIPSGQEVAPDDWALLRTVRQGVTVEDEMLEIDTFDGKRRVILNYTAPVLDEAGRVEAAVVVNQDITDRRGLEDQARQAQLAMQERIKELNCLYRIAEAEDACDDNLDKLLSAVASILTEAFLCPADVSARVVFHGKEFQSTDYRPPVSLLSSRITVAGEEAGFVEASYCVQRPTFEEGPFLKEERALIDAVAARLGRAAERIFARQQVAMERAAVEQKNIALREIMARIQEEKEQLGRQVMANVDRIIMPILDSQAGLASPRQQRYVTMLRNAIREITSPFVERLSSQFTALTPTEMRLCTLIKQGYTGKEIAEIEHTSPDTVRTHRFQIRRKLGLLNKRVNLASYLHSLQ